ncbi:MAG: beta-glucuronidase [Clostridia bacterium]|nr:beta-glucuronidase [Clostridia bacterium]
MNRLFKNSTQRVNIPLNDMWDFVIDPDEKGITEKWYENFPENSRKMNVPACWNSEIDLFRYTGTAWYRTTFTTDCPNVYIYFEAVQNEADVYLDGKHLGNHYGGFLGFGFEANNLSAGVHTLTVRVNNDLNDTDTFPLATVDWFNYGGIARPVTVLPLGKSWISNYQVSYTFTNELKDVCLHIKADVKTFEKQAGEFEIFVNDEKMHGEMMEIDGEKSVSFDIPLENITLWDIHKPALYYVKLAFCGDDIIERIGFREIKTEGQKIMLNRKPIRLLGVNRHEEHPDWGFSMPFPLIKKDIDIIRNLNCNAIRSSHYQNSQKTADYCDEIGMLFWAEIPAWERSPEAFGSELTMERGLSMAKDMVKESFHHPSIIFLCVSNEGATNSQEAYGYVEKTIKQVKELDDSRLVCFVSRQAGPKHDARDLCFPLADVVCLNYYIGWYFPVEDDDWTSFMESYSDFLKEINCYDKPFIMSEFGAAGLMGTNYFESSRWTEDYQADVLEFTLKQLLDNPQISGTYIWQFCDNRSCVNMEIERPRGYNNKGIVDERRHPKRAYRVVQKIYGEHLGLDYPHYETTLFGYSKWKKNDTIKIKV